MVASSSFMVIVSAVTQTFPDPVTSLGTQNNLSQVSDVENWGIQKPATGELFPSVLGRHLVVAMYVCDSQEPCELLQCFGGKGKSLY